MHQNKEMKDLKRSKVEKKAELYSQGLKNSLKKKLLQHDIKSSNLLFSKKTNCCHFIFLFLDSTRAVEFKIIFIYFIQNVVAKASSETSFILSAFQTTFF